MFVPRPKVDSAVLKLTLRDEPSVAPSDKKAFFACVKAGFGQRRKTLLNSLTGYLDMSKEDVGKILALADIDPRRRRRPFPYRNFRGYPIKRRNL